MIFIRFSASLCIIISWIYENAAYVYTLNHLSHVQSHQMYTHTHEHTQTHHTHAGSDHLTLLTEHGDIHTLGCAEQGQLGRIPECFSSRGGRKGTSLLLRPDIVRFRVKKGAGKPKLADVFCGPYHTFAATQRGEVYVWGLNNTMDNCAL